ncbi:MAG: hypothetical protein QNJ90_08060 [Planctomycetota bacterium]|nr:hypothetical protein [Planctomycetota bacterium]
MRQGGTRPTALLIALVLSVLLAACGSADTTARQQVPRLLVIESDGARDGFIRSDGFVRVVGSGPGVGDLDDARPGLSLRMFYSFPLFEIPPDAVISSITLRVYQVATVGQPYADLGDLLVDHVDPGNALGPDDYEENTLTQNVGTLARQFTPRIASLSVDACVLRDLDEGRTRSWFRLRFSRDTNLDDRDDVLIVNDGENSLRAGNVPVLEVIYVRP